MQRMHSRLIVIGLATLLCSIVPSLALAATAPPLGTTLPQFGVLGGAGVSGSTGAGTSVAGDVGSSPTATITNFIGSTIPGPSSTVPPFIVHYTNDAVVQQAHLDAIAAYNNMVTQGTGTPLGPQLDTLILGPGLYSFTSSADLAGGGTLTLNDPTGTGIFIFSVNSALTANVLSRVVGTANPCNIYWRIGTSATLNGNNFWGTVIADQSVTVASSNTLIGRAVGINAAVTMPGGGGNTIGGCSSPAGVVCPVITVNPTTLPSATIGVFYSQTLTATGGTGPYTFTVSSGALPPGLTLPPTGTLSGTPATAANSNFTITATDSSSCPGSRAYALGVGGAAGGPTLDSFGLIALLALLAVAGVFAANRFSA